jgi:hypothetical protein
MMALTATRTGGISPRLHTRTRVTTQTPTQVEALPLGSHLPPVASLRISPNPWRPETRIQLLASQPFDARIELYTIQGRRIRVLEQPRAFDEGLTTLALDGKDAEGRQLPAGTYFVRLIGTDIRTAAKFVVFRE